MTLWHIFFFPWFVFSPRTPIIPVCTVQSASSYWCTDFDEGFFNPPIFYSSSSSETGFGAGWVVSSLQILKRNLEKFHIKMIKLYLLDSFLFYIVKIRYFWSIVCSEKLYIGIISYFYSAWAPYIQPRLVRLHRFEILSYVNSCSRC
jgi:hypothetical protein